ncbi:MAG: hypothetical protein NTZ98_17315 [Acidobacteria bacterium]|jgi:hypothetical protein|nr:hypothetical protein [Acidobacteriota bacterium]
MLRSVALVIVLGLSLKMCRAEDVPIGVSVCQLQENPVAFDKTLVRVRGQISIAFEDFSLTAGTCKSSGAGIWLEFGGDVEAPTIYCCGDHSRKKGTVLKVEGFSLPLKRDRSLRDFLRLVDTQRKPQPGSTQPGIAATITGRFFAGKPWTRSDGKVLYMGYGHLGCCSLLVIQQVSDVAAQRVSH